MIEDIWKESSFAGAVYDLAVEEGELRGRAEGEARGLREAIQLVLEGRFGALDTSIIQALELKSGDELKEIRRHAGTDTLEEARQRLE